MKAESLGIADVKLIEPDVYTDRRGYFYESYNKQGLESLLGREINMVQSNRSFSVKNTLRGMHYQIVRPQGKLVSVLRGAIMDVVIDVRRSSLTFGNWIEVTLSSENKRQLWVPEGMAHGFVVLSEYAEVEYYVTDYYFPEHERCIRWNDSDVGINWPSEIEPVLSDKDANGMLLANAEVYD